MGVPGCPRVVEHAAYLVTRASSDAQPCVRGDRFPVSHRFAALRRRGPSTPALGVRFAENQFTVRHCRTLEDLFPGGASGYIPRYVPYWALSFLSFRRAWAPEPLRSSRRRCRMPGGWAVWAPYSVLSRTCPGNWPLCGNGPRGPLPSIMSCPRSMRPPSPTPWLLDVHFVNPVPVYFGRANM